MGGRRGGGRESPSLLGGNGHPQFQPRRRSGTTRRKLGSHEDGGDDRGPQRSGRNFSHRFSGLGTFAGGPRGGVTLGLGREVPLGSYPCPPWRERSWTRDETRCVCGRGQGSPARAPRLRKSPLRTGWQALSVGPPSRVHPRRRPEGRCRRFLSPVVENEP